MHKNGKERFERELVQFVVEKLEPNLPFFCCRNCYKTKRSIQHWEESPRCANELCKLHGSLCGKIQVKPINFSILTNHEICRMMFSNASSGRSRMYIQIENLRGSCYTAADKPNDVENRNDINETITLQCSLLTSQILDYDTMMFQAMSDTEDREYSNSAMQHYRPYLFSYVMEIDDDTYSKLKILQGKISELEKHDLSHSKDEPSSYFWMPCTFDTENGQSGINLKGYVVQSASSINKIPIGLKIIEDTKVSIAIKKEILEKFKVSTFRPIDDISFIEKIGNNLGQHGISTIDVYKIGNGNCIFAQSVDAETSFFYDIGFNYRHRPEKISHGAVYNYSKTMQEIAKERPSFLILSHWDMDHIAGNIVAKKDIFDKDWFAPDCYDACIDAMRLAKYLDLKGHLFLAKRRCENNVPSGRLIGHQIDIKSGTRALANYRLYMGQKEACDSSRPNCEGIVIEYTDIIKQKKLLMMGDVNYASFNKAYSAATPGASFANMQIDYLVAPHHGSEHTYYSQITESSKNANTGDKAIICCTNCLKDKRPSEAHRAELEKRFGKNVLTTETDVSSPKGVSIKISF